MKIAISIDADRGLESEVSTRFGRARGFLVVDTEKKKHLFIDNLDNSDAAQGAGVQSAQKLIDSGTSVIITGSGRCGPKAFKVLKANDLKIFISPDQTVKAALAAYENNQLTEQTD